MATDAGVTGGLTEVSETCAKDEEQKRSRTLS
jgi:hypothetical protein